MGIYDRYLYRRELATQWKAMPPLRVERWQLKTIISPVLHIVQSINSVCTDVVAIFIFIGPLLQVLDSGICLRSGLARQTPKLDQRFCAG